MVFVETRQILPKDMHILEGSVFKNLQLPVIRENCDEIMDVIARLYRKHIRSNAPKIGNLYQRTNTAVILFFNTTGCRCQMVLAYFICKMAFDDRIDHKYCGDHCIYNREDVVKYWCLKSSI